MIDLPNAPLFLILPVCFAGGIGLGFAYFHALRTTADLLVRGARPLLGVGLTLGRFVFLGAGLFVAVLAGGPALFAALAGVLCARAMMLHGIQRAGA